MQVRHSVTASALVVFLPPHLCEGIQSIRKSHDKAYDRWMPHIELLTPFVPSARFAAAARDLAKVLEGIDPFDVVITDVVVDNRSFVWALAISQPLRAFSELCKAVASVFPEYRQSTVRPHVFLGSARSSEAAWLAERAATVLKAGPTLRFTCNKVSLFTRKDPYTTTEISLCGMRTAWSIAPHGQQALRDSIETRAARRSASAPRGLAPRDASLRTWSTPAHRRRIPLRYAAEACALRFRTWLQTHTEHRPATASALRNLLAASFCRVRVRANPYDVVRELKDSIFEVQQTETSVPSVVVRRSSARGNSDLLPRSQADLTGKVHAWVQRALVNPQLPETSYRKSTVWGHLKVACNTKFMADPAAVLLCLRESRIVIVDDDENVSYTI